jgi:tRNA modification GTPase
VSPEPGTTRDFIEERITVGPYWLRLTDTAGLNPSPTPLEALGMQKTLECAGEADLLLIVLDATDPNWVLPDVPARDDAKRHIILVINKKDLAPLDTRRFDAMPAGASVVRVSALTGDGIEDLLGGIVSVAEKYQQDVGNECIAISSRHVNALALAGECLLAAQAKVSAERSIELLASDIRGALMALGEVIGSIDNERMLDKLFASFCIGK